MLRHSAGFVRFLCVVRDLGQCAAKLTTGFTIDWVVRALTRLEAAAISVATTLVSTASEVAASRARVERIAVCIFGEMLN